MPAVEGAGVGIVGITGISILFPVLRWLLNTYAFEPAANHCLQPVWKSSSSQLTKARIHNDIEKFSESCWKLCIYTVFSSLGAASIWGQPWVLDTKQLWAGWPNQPFAPLMQLLYRLELGFYIASVFMILFWEIRRKDFAAMFSHHIATVILISASLQLGYFRVGTLIMLLHDACDVLMEGAKIAKYCGRENMATVLFGAFTVAWLLLRLIFFPLVVIRSTIMDSYKVMPSDSVYYMFNGLLCMLLALHVNWFRLILRIIWMQLVTGTAHDVREDEDD